MPSITSTPPGPPAGSPSGDPGGFAGVVAFVDDTMPTDAAGRLVEAIAASQQSINHLQGRKVQLIEQLYLRYRDQLLLEDLDPDETDRLLSPGGSQQTSIPDDAGPGPHPPARVDLAQTGIELGMFDRQYVAEAEKTACRMTATELAVRLGQSPQEASALVRRSLAWSLTTPILVEALTRGHLDIDKAITIGAATSVLDTTTAAFANEDETDETDTSGDTEGAPNAEADNPATESSFAQHVPLTVADRVATDVLNQSAGLSRRQINRLLDELVLGADPAAGEKRHQRAVSRRRLLLEPGFDSTAILKVTGTAADLAIAAYDRVDVLARRTKATKRDERSLDQLRADLVLALITGTARFFETNQAEDVSPMAATRTTQPASTPDSRPGSGSAGSGGWSKAPGAGTELILARGERNRRPGSVSDRAPSQSVGCDCTPGGPCHCECGTAYADPTDLAQLEQLHQAHDTRRHSTVATAPASTATPSVEAAQTAPAPAASAGPEPAATSRPSPRDLETYPLVPVAPGEVPGRATRLPDTLLTIPLETVLSWTNTDPSTAHAASGSTGSIQVAGRSSGAQNSAPFGASQDTSSPAWLERVGPVVDSVTQRVLTARLAQTTRDDRDSEFRIAITDKQGRVVQYHAMHGRTLRGLIREAVAVDYGTCLFPTCDTSAIRCQADHAREYAVVRATRIGNIEPLCAPDHTVKSKRGYRIQRTNPQDAGSPATWQLHLRSGLRYQLAVTGTGLGTVLDTARTRPRLRYFDPEKEVRATTPPRTPIAPKHYDPNGPPPF